MLIVITGLDGSGTSTIADGLSKLDDNSIVMKTPGLEFSDRDKIDHIIRQNSKVAHMLYYLSSTVYASDYIRNHYDYQNNNVYVIRYLIDTVVSNRVAGIPIDLNYNVYGNQLIIPDLTLFVGLNEEERQYRITNRGKSELDKVLDDTKTRTSFLEEFDKLLVPDQTIYVNNSKQDIQCTIEDTYQKIKKYNELHKKN